MNIEHLIKMANQIGTFFEPESSRDAAAANIVNHLQKFWDPRMRKQIVEYVDKHGGDGLLPIVLYSIQNGREALGNTWTKTDDKVTQVPAESGTRPH